MLGLILIYWIGKSYYKLAEKHGKHGWGYAIAGVLTYYAGQFVGAIGIVVCMESFGRSVTENDELMLSLVAIPFGALLCWALYVYTKKRLEHPPGSNQDFDDVLDGDFIE